MLPPDQRTLQEHLTSVDFLAGVEKGYWGLAEVPGVAWPELVFWVAPAARPSSPDRFYVRLNATSYPQDPLTGNFCDGSTGQPLTSAQRPKGREQVAKVFRTDWENGRAFYHPYDRVAAQSHPDWNSKYPGLVWDARHTIVDLLSEIRRLLMSEDYSGV